MPKFYVEVECTLKEGDVLPLSFLPYEYFSFDRIEAADEDTAGNIAKNKAIAACLFEPAAVEVVVTEKIDE